MVEVNLGDKKYNVDLQSAKVVKINGKELEYEFSHIIGNNFNLRIANANYNFILSDNEDGKITYLLNGQERQAILKSDLDLLLEKMGFDASASKKVSNIKSPMPGLVLDIEVEQGQAIKEGETVLVLEAMKMENIIKSPCDATIKTVKVAKGDSLEKGTILVEFG